MPRRATEALDGLSRARIAEALGLGGGRQHITAMLMGARPVSSDHIARLAAILRQRAAAMRQVVDEIDGGA